MIIVVKLKYFYTNFFCPKINLEEVYYVIYLATTSVLLHLLQTKLPQEINF